MTFEEALLVIGKTIICYFFLIITLRIMGKREVGKVSTFDIVVFFVISELFSLSLNEAETSILHSLIPVTVIVILQLGTAFLSLKFPKVRNAMEGSTNFIIYKGKIVQSEMKKQRYNIEDLMIQLRSKDVQSPQEVEYGILEDNGSLNVILKEDCEVLYPDPLILDGRINETALKRMEKDQQYLLAELKKQGYTDPKEIFFAMALKDSFYIVPFESSQNINKVK